MTPRATMLGGSAARARRRINGVLAAAGAAVILCAGSLTGAAPAAAHVHAVSPGAVRGSVAIVTFEVPNESPAGSPTIELTVTLPEVAAARTETKPGWVTRLDGDAAAGAVRSVTWTAEPNSGIAAGQFGLFRISMKLPDVETIRFPAVQRYADGTVVNWDQPPRPDGSEPERPAAALSLTAGPVPAPEHHAPAPDSQSQNVAQHPADRPASSAADNPADNPARVLAGVALLLAALATAVAIARRRA